ncbi:hypothetical protein M427DRAFT_138631 [Gonapodya prolifera JEL478]|uniref:Uncharacterized protein n=1 Tax=Gonapodya prolifera (strain JEL478) TaxID=1344416 RepID=A0A139A2S9_GONPJ|nr:hypothetical protein M427DRAFT_138631 [Gonapodya prolifera JEL478]|eukprot:KXS11096.1 hypothetical protein M427DRAFT_138631 [Gonapodya prolifera JEL478]
MKPTKILLKTIFWIAFADFIKQQPARRFWLKFKGADGDHVLEQRDIDRDVKRIVKRFEGEVRKRLMVQSGPKRVLKCGFWYPEGI